MMHPATQALLEHFGTEHLPEELAAVSRPFGELARAVAGQSSGPETSTALRKLLEAKDCAVRAYRTERPEYRGTGQ